MGMMNRKQFAKHKLGDVVKPKTDCGPSQTKQEFARECDANYIVARYATTGILPATRFTPDRAIFADVSKVGDFASEMQRVVEAQSAFDALPAELRARFANDPARLIAFVQDDANYDEAVKLGLIEKKPEASEAAAAAAGGAAKK